MMLNTLMLGLVASASAVSIAPVRAKYYTAEDFGTYKVVNSTHPDCSASTSPKSPDAKPANYVLYKRGMPKPDLGDQYRYFEIPLTAIAVTQSTDVTFLELLGGRMLIDSASPYAGSACVQKMIVDKMIEPYNGLLSNHSDQADGVMSDPYYSKRWAHESSESKVICSASTYEATPLASAEWIKFWGLFLDKDFVAATSFCNSEGRYECNSIAASNIHAMSGGNKLYKVPSVAWVAYEDYSAWGMGINYKIKIPPTKVRYTNDAGGATPDWSEFSDYLEKSWDGLTINGYSFPVANVSLFHKALAQADYIIDETYTATYPYTYADVKASFQVDSSAVEIKAFTNHHVYRVDGTMNSIKSGTDWFESRVAEPDAFLEDLISVLKPVSSTLRPANWKLKYLRHMESTAAVSTTTHEQCLDVAAIRKGRATTCQSLYLSPLVNSITNFSAIQTATCAAVQPPPLISADSEAILDAISKMEKDDSKWSGGAVAAVATCASLLGLALGAIVILVLKSSAAAAPAGKAASASKPTMEMHENPSSQA